jgi:hypothetical protein
VQISNIVVLYLPALQLLSKKTGFWATFSQSKEGLLSGSLNLTRIVILEGVVIVSEMKIQGKLVQSSECEILSALVFNSYFRSWLRALALGSVFNKPARLHLFVSEAILSLPKEECNHPTLFIS